jgi:hypothetical protein
MKETKVDGRGAMESDHVASKATIPHYVVKWRG